MKRILIKETTEKTDEEVVLKGWVERVRSHGKLVFLDLRDRSGLVQVVVNPQVSEDAHKKALDLQPQDAVELTGLVKKRPEGTINRELKTGIIEIETKNLEILSKSQVLPFDMTKKELDLELPTLLDYRPLTLKHPKQQGIFKVQESIMNAFRESSKELGCTEIFIPTIAASSTEGERKYSKSIIMDIRLS
jgi:aspartyl-tRNA synthetase